MSTVISVLGAPPSHLVGRGYSGDPPLVEGKAVRAMHAQDPIGSSVPSEPGR